MVSTEKEEVVWVFQLVDKQNHDGLQVLSSTINIVSQKEVVGSWRESTTVEETEKITVLTVSVSTNSNGRINLNKRVLLHEDILDFS